MSLNNGKTNEFQQSRQQREPFLTMDDLIEFKTQLISEIRKLLTDKIGNPEKKWLKSFEVRKLLNISRGTLQNLRVNGTLPYTKIGGVIYYDYEDIQAMIVTNKTHAL